MFSSYTKAQVHTGRRNKDRNIPKIEPCTASYYCSQKRHHIRRRIQSGYGPYRSTWAVSLFVIVTMQMCAEEECQTKVDLIKP